MRKHTIWPIAFALLIGVGLTGLSVYSQSGLPTATVPVSMVVSLEGKHGKSIPGVNREDVMVFQGSYRAKVTDWTPLLGDKTGLQLFVLIDETTDTSIGMQFDDLRRFISTQPPATELGLGYTRYGMVDIVQDFTSDHSRVAKALRLPTSVGIASPYLSVADLIKHWRDTPQRRVVVMVSNGIDPLQPGPLNPYLDEAIRAAQKAGTQIYTIYASNGGHFGHTLWRINWAQSNLSRLADETGGEGYFQGFATPISFTPYLNEISDRLQHHQYRLTFLARAEKQAAFQRVRLQAEEPDVELVAADQVYVPAAK